MSFNPTKKEFVENYGYTLDEMWYPRVTKIVEIKAKPALYRFYAKVDSFEAGERIKERSAVEGTLVHETVEDLLLGKKPVVQKSIRPSVEAFLTFIEKNNIEVEKEHIEFRLVNYEHRYAGTLDAVAKIGGKTGILDIKTSQEVYRDYNLQTAAYMAAMNGVIKGLDTRWILRIDQVRPCTRCGAVLRSKGGRDKVIIDWKDTKMRNCPHEWGELEGRIELKEFPEWRDDFQAFLGAKKLWEWEYEEMLKDIGYL